jgi:hypothetical protein
LAFNAVQNAADHALKVALGASIVVNELKKEKVCSETNQGEACRDLFDRLANNITDAQRLRLACVVLNAQGKAETMAELNCPTIVSNHPPPAKNP